MSTRYESVLSSMQQKASDAGSKSDFFASAFDHFHHLALTRIPSLTPDRVKFTTERDLWRYLWPREDFPGRSVPPGPLQPPTNTGAVGPKIFEYKARQIVINPFHGTAIQPLYGVDTQGFPYWCFLLPLSELELFKGKEDCNIKNLELEFRILVRIHEVEEYFLVYPEHEEDVPQGWLVPLQGSMDRFYKFIYLLDREARGMSGFFQRDEAAKERTFPEDYLSKFLEQEKNGLLNYETPSPPRPPRSQQLLDSQHLRYTHEYRSQFRKPKNPPAYGANAAWSSSWLVQSYDNKQTGETVVDNEDAEREAGATSLDNNEDAAMEADGTTLDNNEIDTADDFHVPSWDPSND